MKIAIIGSGISGLVCAHRLHKDHEIVLYETSNRVGGHSNTVRVDLADETHYVDTGFIVYNEANYPNFVDILKQLDVQTKPTTMSFSVSNENNGLEYKGTNLNTLFAQRGNIVKPQFYKLLSGIYRFNKTIKALLDDETDDDLISLKTLIDENKYSQTFVDNFLIPFGSAIWSADPQTFLEFPVQTYARFMNNHGLLDVPFKQQWRTIDGGSRQYVKKLTKPFARNIRINSAVKKILRDVGADKKIEIHTSVSEVEEFDRVIIATHSNQALSLLDDPSQAEHEILSALRYQKNSVTLHTDVRELPSKKLAWSSWNYRVPSNPRHSATVTYWMNSLQSIKSSAELLVTLNDDSRIDPSLIIEQFEYEHPNYDIDAITAQKRRGEIQGQRNTYYAGAYWGYGFHEDGVYSALDVVEKLGTTP